MPTFRCQAEIAAPREPLFALTQDYALRPRWDPSHEEARKLDDGRVWYRAKNGLTMTVRYVSHEPPERVAMTMVEGPWIFRRFSGSWIFEALDPSRTRVTFAYHVELRWPLALVDGMMVRRLERTMSERLAGLKTYAERSGPGSRSNP